MSQRRDDHACHRNPATHLASPRRSHRSLGFGQGTQNRSAMHAAVRQRLRLESAMIAAQNPFRPDSCSCLRVQQNTSPICELEPVHILAGPCPRSLRIPATDHLMTCTIPRRNDGSRCRSRYLFPRIPTSPEPRNGAGMDVLEAAFAWGCRSLRECMRSFQGGLLPRSSLWGNGHRNSPVVAHYQIRRQWRRLVWSWIRRPAIAGDCAPAISLARRETRCRAGHTLPLQRTICQR